MDREIEYKEIWDHIDQTLGSFLIASRFDLNIEDNWEIFKLMCNSNVEYHRDKFPKFDSFLKLAEKRKKKFLKEENSWDFAKIYSYLSEKEEQGLFYIGTPLKLVKEITDKISDDFLFETIIENDEKIKILDPACGRGRFMWRMKQRLIDIGLNEKEAIESLYGIDIDPKSVYITAALIDPKKLCKPQIYCADTLNNYPKELKDMKFDVIVGNPPYQAPTKGDYSYWARFIQKAHNLISKDGIIAMITPPGWMSATGDIRKGRISILRDIFSTGHLYYVNTEARLKSFFTGIGSNFTYWLWRNNNDINNKTKFVDDNGVHDIDIKGLPWLPLQINGTTISIVSKITSLDLSNTFSFNRHPYYEYSQLSKQASKSFKFRLFNGNSDKIDEMFYAKEECPYGNVNKVLFPRYGNKTLFIIDPGETGMTDSYFMEITKEEIAGATSVFKSKLFGWIVSHKRTQYNEGSFINFIKKIPLNKVWTNQEIYDYFNLTKEEIELIENAGK